ncbi:MAG: peptide ABC transporter substrate-binding protein [Phycisphaerales bacterium]
MFRLALPFVVLVVVVAAAVLSDRPRPRADFVFINRGDVTTLDLQRMSWQQDLRAARIIFQGLVYSDIFTPDYEARPAVAERWEVSDDGLTWVFHLRDDAKWSNGDVVRPSDFVFSWRRGLLPELASDYFNFFALIRGGRAFFEWRMAALEEYAARPAAERTREAADALWEETLRHFDETVAVTADDEARTLTVVLENRCPYFLDVVAFPCLFPVYPPLVRQYERPDGETGRLIAEHGWTKPPLLVSNGPFVLTEWRFKRYMWFEQNPHYWDRASLGVRTIMSPSVDDNNAQVLAFQTGAVDYVTEVTPAYRGDMLAQKLEFYAEHAEEVAALRAQGLDQFEIDRRLPNDPRAHIHVVPSFGTYFYNFNCEPTLADGRPNPFVDERVRRAFAMMIDKASLVNDVRRLTEPVARTITPPGAIAGYELPAGLACISDYAEGSAERAALISQAKALLAEAGYPDPTRFPTVDILFNKDAGHDLVAQAVAELAGVPGRAGRAEHAGDQGLQGRPDEPQLHGQPRGVVRGLRRPDHVPRPEPDGRWQQRPGVLERGVRRVAGRRGGRAGPADAPGHPDAGRADHCGAGPADGAAVPLCAAADVRCASGVGDLAAPAERRLHLAGGHAG